MLRTAIRLPYLGRFAPIDAAFTELLALAQASRPKTKLDLPSRMCDVLPLQPAGAFLRQNNLLSTPVAPATSTRRHSNPIAVVGSCTDLDEALRLRPECDEEASQLVPNQQDEPEDFLVSIRRGIDELAAESDDEDSDEDSDEDDDDDEEGCYYQSNKANTYYSPDQKLPHGFPLDDAPDLSDTSTASSSLLTAWNHQESDDEQDNKDDLIFQLEM